MISFEYLNLQQIWRYSTAKESAFNFEYFMLMFKNY